MSPICSSRFFACAIILMLIAETAARPSLADLYSQLQAKSMSGSVMRDQPIPLSPKDAAAPPKALLPHIKKLRQNYKLPIHGLDVVTKPTVTAEDKGKPNPKSAAHIINRLSTVLLRI